MMNEIEIIRSARRTLAVEVRPDLRVVVRAPMGMGRKDIQRFIDEKSEWIEAHLRLAAARRAESAPGFTEAELKELVKAAREDIPRRAEKYADLLGVTFGKITIRSQKTRWGSCSAEGNLSFNCLLMLCPEDIRDYVAAHELCHRRELNHSPRFWALVEDILPDYRERRRWLKTNGSALIGRMR